MGKSTIKEVFLPFLRFCLKLVLHISKAKLGLNTISQEQSYFVIVVFRVVSAIFHARTPHKRRKCGVSRKNCCVVSLLQIAPCTFFRRRRFYVLRSKHPLSSAKWDTIQFSHALGNCRVLSFLPPSPLDIMCGQNSSKK